MRYNDVWKTIKSFGSEEAIRMRNCRGCIYLGTVGCSGCCDYWLIADRMRPSKFGEECPVKVMIPGYVIPQEHLDFCKRIDEREKRRKEQAERQAKKRLEWIEKIAEEIKKDELTNSMDQSNDEEQRNPLPRTNNPHGRPVTWDTQYAFSLYMDGYYIFEIAEILGVSISKVTSHAKYHQWAKQFPEDVCRYRHDIDQAKLDYEEYKKRLKAANLDFKKCQKLKVDKSK